MSIRKIVLLLNLIICTSCSEITTTQGNRLAANTENVTFASNDALQTAASKKDVERKVLTKNIDKNGLREIVYGFPNRIISEGGKLSRPENPLPRNLIKQILNEKWIKECRRERKIEDVKEIEESLTNLKIDLNGDSKDDYLIQVGRCAWNASAPTYVYAGEERGSFKLLYYDNAKDVEVLEQKTNDYFDLSS